MLKPESLVPANMALSGNKGFADYHVNVRSSGWAFIQQEDLGLFLFLMSLKGVGAQMHAHRSAPHRRTGGRRPQPGRHRSWERGPVQSLPGTRRGQGLLTRPPASSLQLRDTRNSCCLTLGARGTRQQQPQESSTASDRVLQVGRRLCIRGAGAQHSGKGVEGAPQFRGTFRGHRGAVQSPGFGTVYRKHNST